MNRFFRFSPTRIALGYVALSVAALALFAFPLWYGWQTNLLTFRAYVQGEESQRLVDVFGKDGASGLAAAMASHAENLPKGEIRVFADVAKKRLAGNLPAWPPQVPDAPGVYGLVIDTGGGATTRVVLSHQVLPGGYHLLVGRESARFESLVGIFWYGIAGVFAIVLALGAGIGWLFRRAVLAEQALNRAHDELEGQVAQRTGELKRANEALVLAEERYELAMQAAGDGHTDWNFQTGEFYISPRLLEICGYAPGTTFHDRADWVRRFPFHPEDRPKWEAAVAAHVASRESHFKMEVRIVVRGETRWTTFLFLSTRDASGRQIRWTGSIGDITESKRAEQAQQASEERYALAMEAAGDGHTDWIVAADQFYASPRALEILGLPRDTQFASRADFVRVFPFHPEDRRVWEQELGAYVDHGSGRFELEIRILRQAELRWLHLCVICSRDRVGNPQRLSSSITDITDRKCIEEELRSRQEMLDLAQQAARAVAFDWHTDASKGENRWSPELEAMYGLKPGTYDGTFKGWKELVHPTDWPEVREAVYRANETGDVAAEFRVVQPGGVVRWLQAKGKMLFDAGGTPVRMIGFMLDVTDRHEREEDLRRLEKQLRQAQRLEAMGTLAGGIAHDFNNILGAILGYGEMALRDAPEGSRLRRDLESITAAGERGRALVERILAFSRSGVSERVAVHVEKVVRESIDLLTANLPLGITLKAELRAGRAAMQGDPTQIHQVVMNLASNGIQAMAPGGMLRVALSALHVDTPRIATTGTVAVGDYILLKVADSGTGIPANVLERIFDPFFTTKEVGVGTGLGLSLVHGIVTEVGGAIDVATTPGEGSVFAVYLPRSGDAIDVLEALAPDMPRGAGQRVLVVDDEEPLVRLATATLEDLGYAPVAFTSSTAALQAFRDHPERFDAVVTDERMPRLSGSALIREMRGIRRKIPILLVSGYAGASIVDRAYNSGADEVLKKPLLARELATSLARVLHP